MERQGRSLTAHRAMRGDGDGAPRFWRTAGCRCLLVAVATAGCCPSFVRAADELQQLTRIAFIAGANVYADAGSDDGLRIGQSLQVMRRGETIATLEVTALAAHRAACVRRSGTIELGIDDIVGYSAPHPVSSASGQAEPLAGAEPGEPARPTEPARAPRWGLGPYRRTRAVQRALRITGKADWEYIGTKATLAETDSSSDSFRQRYSVGLDGFLWDPRFVNYSLGLEFARSNVNADTETFSTNDTGYWTQFVFFPQRSFPLRLYARRVANTTSGTPIPDDIRESSAWGVEWRISDTGERRLRLLYDDSSFDLRALPARHEDRRTAVLDAAQRYARGEVSLLVNDEQRLESVLDTEFSRRSGSLVNRTRLDQNSTFVANASRTVSEARFASGEVDELTTTLGSLQFDLPGRERTHWDFAYDYSDNAGKFLAASSHDVRAAGRFSVGRNVELTAGLGGGALHSTSRDFTLDDRHTNAQGGVRYSRGWERFRFVGAYSVIGSQASFNEGPDRKQVGQVAELDGRWTLDSRSEINLTLLQARDKNDTSGLGFTLDERRATLGGGTGLGASGHLDASIGWRSTQRDTFQFGIQESDEITLNATFAGERCSASVGLSSGRGVSDFFPAPGNVTDLEPGTDLVSDSRVAVAGVQWRIAPRLRFRFQARDEHRTFTTFGVQDLRAYHPELEYEIYTWRFSAGVSHYERRDGINYMDDVWILRAAKLFY